MTYLEKLQDSRWKAKRDAVTARDLFTCRQCGCKDRTLDVHHIYYQWGREPWEYHEDELITLCRLCHGSLEDLKKMVGILAVNKSIKERFCAMVHAHTDAIDHNDHKHPLRQTPEAAEECFKRMREEVERVAA